MEFSISKNGQQSGAFAETIVVQMLKGGEVLDEILGDKMEKK